MSQVFTIVVFVLRMGHGQRSGQRVGCGGSREVGQRILTGKVLRHRP